MMSERTRKEIERLANEYKGQVHEWERWERIINAKSEICFGTFRKYVTLKKEVSYEEHTIEEIVEMLNDCAGEDCYCCSWTYVVRDGKPYKEIVRYKWI